MDQNDQLFSFCPYSVNPRGWEGITNPLSSLPELERVLLPAVHLDHIRSSSLPPCLELTHP